MWRAGVQSWACHVARCQNPHPVTYGVTRVGQPQVSAGINTGEGARPFPQSSERLRYMVSPRLRRNAGTSRSACSKLAIMALRMLSTSMTSADADEVPTADALNDGPEDCSRDDARGSSCDSITMRGDSGTESKSSAPAFTVNPVDSVRRRGRSSSLNPVAMTVILTASFIFSSSTAPKIMLASSSAAF